MDREMKKNISFSSNYAVSEVIGGVILVLIALLAFIPIYAYVFPLPLPVADSNVELRAYVNDAGFITIEHIGGEALTSFRIDVWYVNGTTVESEIYSNLQSPWKFGEYKIPTTDIILSSEEDRIGVTVYGYDGEGSEQIIFDGILNGKLEENTEPSLPSEMPMLISNLMTDTVDEDLICFNNTITPGINALTYIYNWKVGGNPITNMLMPFDTNSSDIVKDYSGGNHNGTNYGPSWTSSGIVGGAYSFDGVDDHISIPYCFDTNYIDEITVEAWIKSSSASGVIASFERNTLWELLVDDGVARWFTNVNSDLGDMTGSSNIADGNWHHVASTYDSSTGDGAIYIDGLLDTSNNIHNPGEKLGSGASPNGFIGFSNSGSLPGTWTLLTYDDFEEGFGNYRDGGRDCRLYTGSTYAHQGNNAADIQDNSGDRSSFYHTNGIDVDTPSYTNIKVDFWFYAVSMDPGEDFWVRYYDGSSWTTVADYDVGDEFVNGQFYHETVWINETDYNFPPNMKIKFQCDASGNQDDVYIDQVYVNASTGDKMIGNFSGTIDEFHIYNRTLSKEQIYQNYLCTKDGFSDKSVIVSDETLIADIWSCIVTPNDSTQDDEIVESNTLQIVSYGGG